MVGDQRIVPFAFHYRKSGTGNGPSHLLSELPAKIMILATVPYARPHANLVQFESPRLPVDPRIVKHTVRMANPRAVISEPAPFEHTRLIKHRAVTRWHGQQNHLLHPFGRPDGNDRPADTKQPAHHFRLMAVHAEQQLIHGHEI